ncbi:hypothetical protein FACS189441_5340 [Betaproteobacteria bacterium]|nr:hypothetical protein FACS189441_5340 [Betaproteobacteria bacterium]
MNVHEMLNDLESRSCAHVGGTVRSGSASGKKFGMAVKAVTSWHGRGQIGKGFQTRFYLNGVPTSRSNVISFFEAVDDGITGRGDEDDEQVAVHNTREQTP